MGFPRPNGHSPYTHMDTLHLLTRWLHITAAVAGLGGIFFLVLVMLPALRDAPEAAAIADAVRRRYKRVAHAAIGLLLLTGFYNYLAVTSPKAAAEPFRGTYHMVIGIKILLSLALFTLAILLLVPVRAIHERRRQWLAVNAVLGLVILALAAYLRKLWG